MFIFVCNPRLNENCCNFVFLVALFFKLKVDEVSKIVYIYEFSFLKTCSFSSIVDLDFPNNASSYLPQGYLIRKIGMVSSKN